MLFDPELSYCCGSSSGITWPPLWSSFTGVVSMAVCAWSLDSSLALSGLCLIEGMVVCGYSDSLAVLCGGGSTQLLDRSCSFCVRWYQSILVLSLVALGLKLPAFSGVTVLISVRLKLWFLSYVDFCSSLISLLLVKVPICCLARLH